jgi:hypothetical protein
MFHLPVYFFCCTFSCIFTPSNPLILAVWQSRGEECWHLELPPLLRIDDDEEEEEVQEADVLASPRKAPLLE